MPKNKKPMPPYYPEIRCAMCLLHIDPSKAHVAANAHIEKLVDGVIHVLAAEAIAHYCLSCSPYNI